jgi:hypothetical protein
MANLTLAIDEEVLHEARKYALEHRTTVNQLVREYLATLNAQEERRRVAGERLKEIMERGLVDVGPITWKREDLYERK